MRFQWSRGSMLKRRRPEAEEKKPRERPLSARTRPFLMADPHSTPYARETASTSRARSAFWAAQGRPSLPSRLPTKPPDVWTRSSCPTKVPRVFVCSPPKLSITAPNLPQLPVRCQLNAQDTRNCLAHRRCCGTHPRSRFPPGPRPIVAEI